jgi:hypothetical protein
MNGMITAAWYGNSANTADSSRGVDVTDYVRLAAGAAMDIPVTNQYFHNDPDPNIPKNLYITRDNGNTLITPEGQVVSKANIVNTMVLNMIVPATLVDPLFQEDKYSCPSGPLVFTEIGAGVMGANSCFTAEGKFNPSLVCIQRLFQAAGGSPKGTLYPKTKEAAAALAQKDPATNEISLDATMNYFNALISLFIQALNYLKFQFQNQTASYYTWQMCTGLPGFTDSNFFYPRLPCFPYQFIASISVTCYVDCLAALS